MKYSKAAAIVAGSLIALGAASAASTAHAAEGPHSGQPNTQGGSHTTVTNGPVNNVSQPASPLEKVTKQAGSVLKKTAQVDPTRALGGGLPTAG